MIITITFFLFSYIHVRHIEPNWTCSWARFTLVANRTVNAFAVHWTADDRVKITTVPNQTEPNRTGTGQHHAFRNSTFSSLDFRILTRSLFSLNIPTAWKVLTRIMALSFNRSRWDKCDWVERQNFPLIAQLHLQESRSPLRLRASAPLDFWTMLTAPLRSAARPD